MCDAAGEELGRLRRYTGLLGLLGAAGVIAAHASAAPAPTLFRLTIVGTAHQEWSFTAAPVESGDCRRTETSEGIRTASFRTSAPVVVRLAGGRVLPVDVPGIMGTVILTGANTTEQTCGDVSTGQVADCVQTKRPFSAASLHAVSPRPGVLTLNKIGNVRLATVACPHEPPDISRRPLGPSLNLLRLPKEALTERRIARLNLHASRTQRTLYGSPEAGSLEESVGWTLTFVRVEG
jgi:hypothetical protein